MARQYFKILGTVSLILLLWWSPSQAAPAAITPLQQPNWSELSPEQKQILAPLASDWDGYPSFRRKKWLGIAQRYPSMTAEQQQRVRTQMKPWASLTPAERDAVRAKYKKHKTETAEQRADRRKKWEQYQALPEAEKKKLREAAAKKRLQKRSGIRSTTTPSSRVPKSNSATPITDQGQVHVPLIQKTPGSPSDSPGHAPAASK